MWVKPKKEDEKKINEVVAHWSCRPCDQRRLLLFPWGVGRYDWAGFPNANEATDESRWIRCLSIKEHPTSFFLHFSPFSRHLWSLKSHPACFQLSYSRNSQDQHLWVLSVIYLCVCVCVCVGGLLAFDRTLTVPTYLSVCTQMCVYVCTKMLAQSHRGWRALLISRQQERSSSSILTPAQVATLITLQ